MHCVARRGRQPRQRAPQLLRPGGPAHRTLLSMSAPEVADIVGTCNPVALTRVVKELGEPSAAVDVDDPASVARVVMTSLREIGPRAHRRTNLALSALVQPAWRAVVEALGARSTDPSIDDLTRAFHAVSTEIPISACRLVVAVGIEQRVPAESALRELAESDQRFAVVEKQGGVVIPLREAPKPDTRTREQRRRRRKEQAAERRARDDQRQQATPFEGGELPLRDDVDDDTPAVRIDEIASMRAVHPDCPLGSTARANRWAFLAPRTSHGAAAPTRENAGRLSSSVRVAATCGCDPVTRATTSPVGGGRYELSIGPMQVLLMRVLSPSTL
jgi:hypothetical protein